MYDELEQTGRCPCKQAKQESDSRLCLSTSSSNVSLLWYWNSLEVTIPTSHWQLERINWQGCTGYKYSVLLAIPGTALVRAMIKAALRASWCHAPSTCPLSLTTCHVRPVCMQACIHKITINFSQNNCKLGVTYIQAPCCRNWIS